MVRHAPDPPPSARRRLLLGGVALLIALGAWLILWRGSLPSLPAEEARAIAEAFLGDIRAGRPDAAWDRTNAEFRSYLGRDRFRAFVRAQPVLRGAAEFERFERTTTNGLPLAECVFRPAAGAKLIRVVLGPEQGAWKVERLYIE